MALETQRSRFAARKRPTRAEIEPAALALLQRHGAAIMATARRFAATPEDAEDAYQRGVEILLTKAPTTAEEELVPWLRTVVKHEAWALRRQRERAAPVADDGEVPEPPSEVALTHDQAERLDRLRLGAEAMRQLKPQEVRALLLKAEGYSYKQIQDITGWTYTKVNRCLTEGRKAFLERVAGIEARRRVRAAGAAALEARRRRGDRRGPGDPAPAPAHLPRLPGGAARVPQRAGDAPRRSCRSPLVASHGRPALLELPARAAEALAGWAQKAHTAVEMASAQKVAAVAASTAVLGGGAAVTVERIERPEPAGRRAVRPSATTRQRPRRAVVAQAAPAPASAEHRPRARPGRRGRGAARGACACDRAQDAARRSRSSSPRGRRAHRGRERDRDG